jgi:hypothetical protein
MPGKNTEESPIADYMTPFKLYRSGVGDGSANYNDVVLDITDLIPLGDSISAYRNNSIALYFDRTSGDKHPFDVCAYATITDASSPLKAITEATPILQAFEPSVDDGKVLILDTDIIAADYRIALKGVNDGVYDIYASWTGGKAQSTRVTELPVVGRGNGPISC